LLERGTLILKFIASAPKSTELTLARVLVA